MVPYNGKRGENRRPVYIECAAGRVVFHPDRTPLDEPLNAYAVRGEVDRRLARQKERLPPAQAAAFTPYLMLLIRPDGVSTYYRFREALQDYKIDFGYEFVDKDWVLDFPEDSQGGPSPSWMTAAKPSTTDRWPPLRRTLWPTGCTASPPPPGTAAARTNRTRVDLRPDRPACHRRLLRARRMPPDRVEFHPRRRTPLRTGRTASPPLPARAAR